MDTNRFYLTEMGFVSLILAVLSLVVTVNLVQGRSKYRSRWLLTSFFIAVIANSLVMLAANGWVFWGNMLMPAQDACVLLGGVALAQFAYHYPQFDQKHEARWVLVFTSSVALFALGYSIYYAWLYIFSYTPSLRINQAYYLLLPLMTLFIIFVFLRRAAHYTQIFNETKYGAGVRLRGYAGAFMHPQQRHVRSLRDFALAVSLGLLPGIAFFLKPVTFIPNWLPTYMLSIGSVLAVSAIALVYLNNSGEQTSLTGKIMGVSLVTILLLFGAFGSSVINNFQNQNDKEKRTQLSLAYHALMDDQKPILPDSISYVAAWNAGEIIPEKIGTTANTGPGNSRLLYLHPGRKDLNINDLAQENQLIFSGLSPEVNPISGINHKEFEPASLNPTQLIFRYIDFPFGSTLHYEGYLFNNNDTVYEIGISRFDELQKTHELVVYLMFWVFLSSLIILVFFPIFYRLNLIRPLDNLIKSVSLANRGELNIQTPVQYEDEIGFLTRSFNRFLATLEKSKQASQEINEELQKRMEELRISEEKFAKSFHSSPVSMVLQKEDDQTYLDVNAAFTKVTGYKREEALGRRPGELNLYPTQDESRRVSRAFAQAEGRLRDFEFEFQRKSGELGTGLLSSEFIDLKGTRLLLGIVTDITNRKQAEEQIQLLHAETEKRVVARSRELSAFLDLAFLVSNPANTHQIYLPVLERVLEISELKVVCLHSCSKDKLDLTLEAQVGLEENEVEQVSLFASSSNLARWLSTPKDALLLSDLTADRILPVEMRLPRLGSCLVAQLVAQGEVLGIMSCYRQEVHTFSIEEISLLVAVAEQLGISLENQRLRQKAERTAISAERQRLARDLHDSITQSIYGLTLFTRSSQDALQTGDQVKLAENLQFIEENALIVLKELRLLLYQMHPEIISERLCDRVNARLDLVERRLGIQADCKIDETIELSPDEQAGIFGIVLEALNNSLKHAHAGKVNISLAQENGALVLEVYDDGQGFEYNDLLQESMPQGMGLRNMKFRAVELDGKLEIITSPGGGTRVYMRIEKESSHKKRSSI